MKIIYVSRKAKAECVVNTWHLCLMFGRWFLRLRIMGIEFGVEL